ncbi:TetR/AcrR family transcriptional regulator [Streptomyces spiralis]|uniref:TetR/AcrR family transcriptional regulator n=1 Tax=Streptomyces spiralis TaxID=66376 RepID=UPI0033C3E88A
MTTVKRDARTQLLEAAERLFAQRGLEAVSMREIVQAAGQRNHAAIQYHFGGRDGLVRALYEYRLPPLNRRRHDLLNYLQASGGQADVRAVVTAYAQPLVETVQQNGGWYARFFNFFVATGQSLSEPIEDDYISGAHECIHLLEQLLSYIPGEILTERLRQMVLLVAAAAADLERRRESGVPEELPVQAFTANLVDTATALLSAPVSPATISALVPGSTVGADT